MASSKSSAGDPDDDPDLDDVEVEEKAKTRRRSSSPSPRKKKSNGSRPVQKWKSGEEEGEDEEGESAAPVDRKPIYWRARDSLYFEPLVALAIIVVLLVALFAYTQNWPPIYVIESNSMQHGSGDTPGLINAGDLVLAQKIPFDQISPYVVGVRTGYETYGEYGDVLLYQPNGIAGTPVIHRSILYLVYNPATNSYNASDLGGLPCGNASDAIYSTPGTPNDCGTTDLTGTLNLYRIGWMSVSFSLDLGAAALGQHSGFVTMGDNNFGCLGPNNCIGVPDQQGVTTPAISSLVEPGWIVGVARGMIPWVGGLKLAISGDASKVPPQSWQYLGLTIVGLIVLAFGIHFLLRREGVESDLRRQEDETQAADAAGDEADEESEEEETPPKRTSSLKPWRRSEEDDDLSAEEGKHSTSKSTARRQGRPRPQVKRSRSKRKSANDDDEL